jgi:excisionase family DNA binding protein
MADSSGLWTVDEVASHLSVSRQTVYRWTAEGLLAVVVLRRTKRWRKEDVERFIRLRRKQET